MGGSASKQTINTETNELKQKNVEVRVDPEQKEIQMDKQQLTELDRKMLLEEQ